MSLKALLFDFNGTIVDDDSIRRELIADILLGENLRPSVKDYDALCQGRSDRACLRAILGDRGRVVEDAYLDKLLAGHSTAYRQRLDTLEQLPIYAGTGEFVNQLWAAGLVMAIVTSSTRTDVDYLLERAKLAEPFDAIVTADDLDTGKLVPDAYLLAIERLNRHYPDLGLQPHDCLAVEGTPVGIAAARQAGIQVVGVAHAYPLHMIQRQADWAVDRLGELELERVKQVFAKGTVGKLA
ncbi:putative phosphatase/phosphohexomutase [Rubidibacter lacunae KORDI 51-2]|uniref:Putative phosphatase/phosphohexomutase n=1 Tax=Rubidibacter lacunae KORDI 51-2 TaxID=582515 RepID=U5DFU0_9CHRO|nr:HAD family phosphatase [Rubidibacter lacunae]ERN40466.1 putative phosphatase/phosphohexomutase [Rubidibacter lacunae KORDI 51-2]